jgi:hypothetical protein
VSHNIKEIDELILWAEWVKDYLNELAQHIEREEWEDIAKAENAYALMLQDIAGYIPGLASVVDKQADD